MEATCLDVMNLFIVLGSEAIIVVRCYFWMSSYLHWVSKSHFMAENVQPGGTRWDSNPWAVVMEYFKGGYPEQPLKMLWLMSDGRQTLSMEAKLRSAQLLFCMLCPRLYLGGEPREANRGMD
jgi:hypothetical protein